MKAILNESGLCDYCTKLSIQNKNQSYLTDEWVNLNDDLFLKMSM
jgi:hypothetical protein